MKNSLNRRESGRSRRKILSKSYEKDVIHPALETLEGRRMLTAVNPVISEIMAGNKTGIKDSFGVNADWLEIANPDPRQTVNLTGWKLQYKNTIWNFPAMSL